MDMEQMHKFSFKMEDEQGQLIVSGEISGKAEVPLLDDLKFKAVLALLNSIDHKNFSESKNEPIFDHNLTEIEETIIEMKKHMEFQGNSSLS